MKKMVMFILFLAIAVIPAGCRKGEPQRIDIVAEPFPRSISEAEIMDAAARAAPAEEAAPEQGTDAAARPAGGGYGSSGTKGVKVLCSSFGLAAKEEWEAKGYIVEGDVARKGSLSFDILEKEVCKDSFDDVNCREECLKINEALASAVIDENGVTCNCVPVQS